MPKGASVNKFTMWVDGKEIHGELVEAGKAREIYTDIVRRTQDPGLLEYIGNNLLQMQRLPGAGQRRPEGHPQLHLASLPSDGNLVEYVYPLKTDGKATATLEEFSHQRHHQVASTASEHLQPDARHHPQAQRATTS